MNITINKDLTGQDILTVGIKKIVFNSSLCFNFNDGGDALYVMRASNKDDFNKTNLNLYEYLTELINISNDGIIHMLKDRLNKYSRYLVGLEVNKERQYVYIISEVEKVIQELL